MSAFRGSELADQIVVICVTCTALHSSRGALPWRRYMFSELCLRLGPLQ